MSGRPCIIFPAWGSPRYAEVLGPAEHSDYCVIQLPRGTVLDWPKDQLEEYDGADQAETRLRDLREADRRARKYI